MPVSDPIRFWLAYRKERWELIGEVWTREDEQRALDDSIPEVPTGFKQHKGSHQFVMAEADRLNQAQRRQGYMNYFYFAEHGEGHN